MEYQHFFNGAVEELLHTSAIYNDEQGRYADEVPASETLRYDIEKGNPEWSDFFQANHDLLVDLNREVPQERLGALFILEITQVQPGAFEEAGSEELSEACDAYYKDFHDFHIENGEVHYA